MRPLTRTLCASVLVGTALAVAHLGWIDGWSREYTQTALHRALITFGVARGLNGVISVAQGTEVAIQPAGIGVNFTPGQILDPINDLIERFSWVMLAASTSLGIQRVLIDVTNWWVFTALMTACGIAAVVTTALKPRVPHWIHVIAVKAALISLIVRFLVPTLAIGAESFYSFFLASQYQESTEKLEQSTSTIGQINRSQQHDIDPRRNSNILENAKRLYQSATASFDIQGRIEQYKLAAAEVSEYAVNLIVVFVLQTVLFPLAFMWGVMRVIKIILVSPWPRPLT